MHQKPYMLSWYSRMSLKRGPLYHTHAEHESEFIIAKDTPYLALMSELWGVFCENFWEKRYNGTTLYAVAVRSISVSVHNPPSVLCTGRRGTLRVSFCGPHRSCYNQEKIQTLVELRKMAHICRHYGQIVLFCLSHCPYNVFVICITSKTVLV